MLEGPKKRRGTRVTNLQLTHVTLKSVKSSRSPVRVLIILFTSSTSIFLKIKSGILSLIVTNFGTIFKIKRLAELKQNV